MQKTDINEWVLKVAEKKLWIDGMVSDLRNFGARVEYELGKERVVSALHYKIKFFFDDHRAIVTIGIILMDYQTDSDLVIATMTTLPAHRRRDGFDTDAIGRIKEWALSNNLRNVRATQVSGFENEKFWMKNGFRKLEGENPCNDFVCQL